MKSFVYKHLFDLVGGARENQLPSAAVTPCPSGDPGSSQTFSVPSPLGSPPHPSEVPSPAPLPTLLTVASLTMPSPLPSPGLSPNPNSPPFSPLIPRQTSSPPPFLHALTVRRGVAHPLLIAEETPSFLTLPITLERQGLPFSSSWVLPEPLVSPFSSPPQVDPEDTVPSPGAKVNVKVVPSSDDKAQGTSPLAVVITPSALLFSPLLAPPELPRPPLDLPSLNSPLPPVSTEVFANIPSSPVEISTDPPSPACAPPILPVPINPPTMFASTSYRDILPFLYNVTHSPFLNDGSISTSSGTLASSLCSDGEAPIISLEEVLP